MEAGFFYVLRGQKKKFKNFFKKFFLQVLEVRQHIFIDCLSAGAEKSLGADHNNTKMVCAVTAYIAQPLERLEFSYVAKIYVAKIQRATYVPVLYYCCII